MASAPNPAVAARLWSAGPDNRPSRAKARCLGRGGVFMQMRKMVKRQLRWRPTLFLKGGGGVEQWGGGAISERLAASIRPEQAGVGGQHGILVSALDRGA
jgi:hypothetical protein